MSTRRMRNVGESLLVVVGLAMILVPVGWAGASTAQLGAVLAGLVLLFLGARRISRYVFSRKRRYFELRRVVRGFLEDVRALNRVAVEERPDEAEDLRRRLHDRVDSMVLAAGWDGDLELETLGGPQAAPAGSRVADEEHGASSHPSPTRLRKITDRVLVGSGALVVLAAALTMTRSPWFVGVVGVGALLIQAGVWRLADPILPSDRTYLPLRRQVDAFLADVRTLNRHAVEGETDAVETLRDRLHARVDILCEVAGQRGGGERRKPRRGGPRGA